MKNRYKNFVTETTEEITSKVSEEKSNDLITSVPSITVPNIYSKKYVTPPIPEGYKHIIGTWNNGFVIERISDGSQFVWIPVGWLDSNGTLDGQHFVEKFGRRNYRNNEFSDDGYSEKLEEELSMQLESVKKYGGFYISRYDISKSSEGKPQSIKGVIPWNAICFYDAKKVAAAFENNEQVKSHLPYGSEHDSVLEWFIKSKAKTLKEIAEDSNDWGNHSTTKQDSSKLVETGSCEKWCVNNIYDFAGNVDELTQETAERCCCTIRGGNYSYSGIVYTAAHRNYDHYDIDDCHDGFRIALYIK